MRRAIYVIGICSAIFIGAGAADCGDAAGDKSINGQPCKVLNEEKWTNARHYVCEDTDKGRVWVEQA